MIEVNLDRYILDLYETVMELGPLWSQFLLLFKVCTHTHTHTQTQKRKHVFQKIFCNNVPNITLFSKFIKNNSTFIWSVLYLTVVHNLKNPGSEIPALAKGRFSSLKPSSPNLQPSYPPIQLLLVSHLGGKAVGA